MQQREIAAEFHVPHAHPSLRAFRALVLAAWLLPAVALPASAAPTGSAISVYVAQYSPDRLLEILREYSPDFESSYLATVAYSRFLIDGHWIRWELEGQLVQHWGQQSHQELNGAIVARWLRFPWDRFLDTSLAVGEGLSIASRVPPLEPRSGPTEGESTRLLNYLLVELEFAPPQDSPWSAFVRIHHRSGIYGIFGNIKGGSNFIGLGLRYTLPKR